MLGHSIIWSGIGAVALAVGIGVQLGESAVSQIDPLYFAGPAVHPRDRGAALDPNNLPGPITSPYLQAYGWAQSQAALPAFSGGPEYPYAPNPEPVIQQASDEQPWEVVQAPSMAPWPPGQVSDNPQIERYASYPIEEKRTTPPETEATPVAQAGAPPRPQPAAQQLATAPVLVYDR